MNRESDQALANYLVGLGDDELILAHRDSEWAGHAPILEEDIAFANIALDEMGHAAAWYRLAGELRGESPETYPDELVFARPAEDFRNVQMVELPNGDWAFSLLRQYLFDSYEAVRLEALSNSEWSPLAETASKVRPEELYHARHTKAWVRRLGRGTKESNRRMQQALDELYPYALQLFAEEGTEPIRDDGLRESWKRDVQQVLGEANLAIPNVREPAVLERSQHSPHLSELVEQMQEVARLEAGVKW